MALHSPQPCPLPVGDRWYILRGYVMVPVVPVDQFPLQILGLPRQLTHRQISDENWKLLQGTEHPTTLRTFQATSSISPPEPTPAPKSRFFAPDHFVSDDSMSQIYDPRLRRRCQLPQTADKSAPEISSQSVVPESERSIADCFASMYQKDAQRVGYRLPYPSGIEPDPSKKVFCSYWIKTGECAFAAQGCRYKHVMPGIEQLRSLGFQQVPKWYKDKMSMKSRGQTWIQRHLGASNEGFDDTSDPCAFPHSSTFKLRQSEGDDQPHEKRDASFFTRRDPPAMFSGALKTSRQSSPITECKARCGNQISDLLIDLDDTPAPLNPRRSKTSFASFKSCDNSAASSCTSAPSSPVALRPKPQMAQYVAPAHKVEAKEKYKKTEQRKVYCQSPALSDSDGGHKALPAHKNNKPKNATGRAPRRGIFQAKRQGLECSKHAPVDNHSTSQLTAVKSPSCEAVLQKGQRSHHSGTAKEDRSAW